MKYILLLVVFSASTLLSQSDDNFAKHTAGLIGSYSIFLGDYGATYNNAPGIGLSYEYRSVREFSFGGQVSFQRWGDVRNGNAQFPYNQYLDDFKFAGFAKAFIDAPEGYDAYFGLGLSYNSIDFINDKDQGNNKYLRYSSNDGVLGIDGFFGANTAVYEKIKVGAKANLGWLNMQNSAFYVSLEIGVFYGF